jgi:hypothetical protein
MLCDSNGEMRMDFVGKMENLDHDWREVCQRIGIEYQPLQSKNVTRHNHYSEYYDDECRELVSRHWAREIEWFGYTFES